MYLINFSVAAICLVIGGYAFHVWNVLDREDKVTKFLWITQLILAIVNIAFGVYGGVWG